MSEKAAERPSSEGHNTHSAQGPTFSDLFKREHVAHHIQPVHAEHHGHSQHAEHHHGKAHKTDAHPRVEAAPPTAAQQVDTFFTNIYKDVQEKQRETKQWSANVDRNMVQKLNNFGDELRREQDHLDDKYNPIKWIGNKLNNL